MLTEYFWVLSSVLLLVVQILVLIRVCRNLHLGFFNPLVVYLGVWITVYMLYVGNFVSFNEVNPKTWIALMSGHIMFTVGGLHSIIYSHHAFGARSQVTGDSVFALTAKKYVYGKWMSIFFLLGLGVFSLYVSDVLSQYGSLSEVLLAPWVIRAGIGELEIGHSYKFIYLMMPLSVISSLYLLFNRRNIVAWVILFAALFSTIATTGRSNFVWCVIWISFAFMYGWRINKLTPKMLFGTTFVLILSLTTFVIMGFWLGKSIENQTSFRDYGTYGNFLVLPYVYLEGGIPAFQAHLEEGETKKFGRNSFLPLVKLYKFLKNEPAPSEIEEFVDIPFPFNTSTYLLPAFQDFGLLGVVVMPFIYGFGAMLCFSYMWYCEQNLFMIFLSSLITSVIVFSFGSNKMVSFATWMFVLVGYIFFLMVNNRHFRSSVGRSGSYAE